LFIIAVVILLRLPLRGDIPQQMIDDVEMLKKQSDTKTELAENIYKFVSNKYTSQSREYFRQPDKLFLKNIEKIYSINQNYIPSNTQNEIFKLMLIQSKDFEEKDFTFVQTTCRSVLKVPIPHEHWDLDINGKVAFVDVWFDDRSLLDNPFGCFAEFPCGNENAVCAEGFGN